MSTMEEETVSIGIWQNGMHFSIRTKKSVADKMGEIAEQDPEKWKGRDLDLLREAHKAVNAEKAQSQQ